MFSKHTSCRKTAKNLPNATKTQLQHEHIGHTTNKRLKTMHPISIPTLCRRPIRHSRTGKRHAERERGRTEMVTHREMCIYTTTRGILLLDKSVKTAVQPGRPTCTQLFLNICIHTWSLTQSSIHTILQSAYLAMMSCLSLWQGPQSCCLIGRQLLSEPALHPWQEKENRPPRWYRCNTHVFCLSSTNLTSQQAQVKII